MDNVYQQTKNVYVDPLDGLQQETMGEYLVENFSCVLSDGDCRVYLIKEYSMEVETSMTLIYTVDGSTFFFWNKEIIEEEETSKTLDLLYDYIPRQTLVDITSEKPERFKLYP